MKAYGFPLVQYDNGDILGLCFKEDGTYLGRNVSPSIEELNKNLAECGKDLEYSFLEDPNALPDNIKSELEKNGTKE